MDPASFDADTYMKVLDIQARANKQQREQLDSIMEGHTKTAGAVGLSQAQALVQNAFQGFFDQ